ncbi:MAG TPA: protein-L-isoaspartate(D-aspartate) O-methyltransferase [Thermoanaerobaculia bacterium]|nr:protein-L-isoaspartate(D-aspartate) O-methyltransferase [Thermoanaerobaculia bacterium]
MTGVPIPKERIPPDARSDSQRREMVERFVAARGVDDPRVLEAMREVPRHRFVPEPLRAKAYGDHSLPIGHGQTISQPSVVGLMTQRLAVAPGQKVLEIGTGSGYQAAVLSRIARTVYSLERIDDLARAAAQTLGGLGYQNVSVKTFDGTYGYPAAAPFDRILITAGTAEIPETLLAQLAVGGRLVAPVGPPERQRIRVVRRRKTDFAREDGEEVVFVPLIGRFGRAPS